MSDEQPSDDVGVADGFYDPLDGWEPDASDFDPAGDHEPADAAEGVTAAGGAQRRMARRILAAIGALVVLVTAVSISAAVFHRQDPGLEYRYVIPHGTAERLAAGEDVEVLPARIEMRTQDTLVIENRDHDTFAVGGLRVGPEQTMTYTFSKPGNYGGSCQLHEGGSVDIVVV